MDDLLLALKEMIEHVEEQNLLIAEVFLLNGYDPEILDVEFMKRTGVHLRDFCKMYEQLCKDARVKWNLPRDSEVQ